METIDLYCERIDSGLWAEPVNAATNAAFLLAAWCAWHLARRSGGPTSGTWLLLGLMAAIGVGSALFHTFATTWTRVLDVLPILLFQVAYLWLYNRQVIKTNRAYAGGLLVAFLLAAYFGRQFPDLLNGSLTYAPALLLILGLGLDHYLRSRHARFALLGAGGVFFVSLIFRTIDDAICISFPLGTHFLWHLLNAVALYVSVRALLLNLPRSSKRLGGFLIGNQS